MAMQIPRGEIVETADHRVVMDGISWDDYEALLRMRADRSMPRMVYLDGALELMTTSEDHEDIKSRISRLLEAFLLDAGIGFNAYGGWTMKDRDEHAGIEADECYRLGPDQTRGRAPDLAIEVIWTHGGLSKLEAYRRLRVREVWFWDAGEIEIHVLGPRGYERRDRSVVVPGIDLAELGTFVREPMLSEAIRTYGDALRSRRVGPTR